MKRVFASKLASERIWIARVYETVMEPGAGGTKVKSSLASRFRRKLHTKRGLKEIRLERPRSKVPACCCKCIRVSHGHSSQRFATALALSEVTTQPQAVKTDFDPVQDRAQVVQILRDGCAHMRKAFDIESINLDELISTALNDPKAVSADIKAFHGINFADLNTAYHQFCKNESVANPVVDLGQVIEFFNKRRRRSA